MAEVMCYTSYKEEKKVYFLLLWYI